MDTGKIIAHVEIPAAPPSKLLPNNRRRQGHWAIQANATAEARAFACLHIVDQLGSIATPYTGPIHLFIHIRYPKKRKMPDVDGSHGATKGFQDSLADAGVILDDKQIVMTTIYAERTDTPKKDDPYPEGFTHMTLMPFDGFVCPCGTMEGRRL